MKKILFTHFFYSFYFWKKRPQFISIFHIKISNVEKSSICRVNYELVKDKISTLGVLDYWCNLKKIFHFFLGIFGRKKYSVKLYILEKKQHNKYHETANPFDIILQQTFYSIDAQWAKKLKDSTIKNYWISARGEIKLHSLETSALFQQFFVGLFFHFLPHGASID